MIRPHTYLDLRARAQAAYDRWQGMVSDMKFADRVSNSETDQCYELQKQYFAAKEAADFLKPAPLKRPA